MKAIIEKSEKYQLAVTHYLDTVSDEERVNAAADAEKMESLDPENWAKDFC